LDFVIVILLYIKYIDWLTKSHSPWKRNFTVLVPSLTSPKLSLTGCDSFNLQPKMYTTQSLLFNYKILPRRQLFSVWIGSATPIRQKLMLLYLNAHWSPPPLPRLISIFISDQTNSNQTLVSDFYENKAIIATCADPLSSFPLRPKSSRPSRKIVWKMNENKSSRYYLKTVAIGNYSQIFINK